MDEILVPHNTITLVDITTKSLIQNVMQNEDDILLVSKHGDPDKASLHLGKNDTVTVDSPVYLWYKSDWDNVLFPIVEF